jgi:NADH:ubiquinone oxidoreductase subunit 2 (subunit N)
MYMREPKEVVSLSSAIPLSIALGVSLVAVLVIGVFPSFLVGLARAAIAGF